MDKLFTAAVTCPFFNVNNELTAYIPLLLTVFVNVDDNFFINKKTRKERAGIVQANRLRAVMEKDRVRMNAECIPGPDLHSWTYR